MKLLPENIKAVKGKISFIRNPSFDQMGGEFRVCIWFEDVLYEDEPSAIFVAFSVDPEFESPETITDPFSYLEDNFRLLNGHAEIIFADDNTFYFGYAHNRIEVEKVGFGKIQSDFIETTIELLFDLESEGAGESFTKIINMQLEYKSDPEELTFA
jgi:hypothetical protein